MPEKRIQPLEIGEDDKINLYFSRNSVHNAVISGGGYAFEISTPSWFSSPRITTIYQLDTKTDQKNVIAEIHWRCFVQNLVRLGGEKQYQPWMPDGEFVVKDKFFSTSRVFMGAYGRRYRWRIRCNRLVLTAEDGSSHSPEVAKFKRSKYNLLFQETRKSHLQISPELMGSFGPLLASWVLMEKWRKDRERAASGHGGGGP